MSKQAWIVSGMVVVVGVVLYLRARQAATVTPGKTEAKKETPLPGGKPKQTPAQVAATVAGIAEAAGRVDPYQLTTQKPKKPTKIGTVQL